MFLLNMVCRCREITADVWNPGLHCLLSHVPLAKVHILVYWLLLQDHCISRQNALVHVDGPLAISRQVRATTPCNRASATVCIPLLHGKSIGKASCLGPIHDIDYAGWFTLLLAGETLSFEACSTRFRTATLFHITDTPGSLTKCELHKLFLVQFSLALSLRETNERVLRQDSRRVMKGGWWRLLLLPSNQLHLSWTDQGSPGLFSRPNWQGLPVRYGRPVPCQLLLLLDTELITAKKWRSVIQLVIRITIVGVIGADFCSRLPPALSCGGRFSRGYWLPIPSVHRRCLDVFAYIIATVVAKVLLVYSLEIVEARFAEVRSILDELPLSVEKHLLRTQI